MSVDTTVKCESCGTVLDEDPGKPTDDPCAECGSMSRVISIVVQEDVTVEIHDNIRVKDIDPSRSSRKKLRKRVFAGDDYFVTEQRWVRKERIIDRDNNRYFEKVWDEETGEVLREVDEKLSDHWGHGSAKK